MNLNNKTNKNKEEFMKGDNLKILCVENSNEIIDKVKIANTFKKRLIGLMFKKNMEYPLLFEIDGKLNGKYRSSIHSCFMRFELKLVFVDDENMVYEIVDLKPWRYYVPKKGAKYIIEFEKNKFKSDDLKIGDEIILK